MQPDLLFPPPGNWAELPADILQLVFSHLLGPPPAPAAGLPLPRLATQ